MLRLSEDAVSLAVREGLPVMYVTEDTTRAHPDHVRAHVHDRDPRRSGPRLRLRHGRARDAQRRAEPGGVRRRSVVDEVNPEVKVDWHGHQDRGLGVTNALWALEAGAHRVHACALGIGERVGNTPMDQLLVNLQLLGWIDRDLTRLHDYCAAVSEATGVRIPDNYPIVGRDAFRTGTGVHAAAIIKARKKGDEWLSDRVYSGVPASHGRPPPGHRGRADERALQRPVLAREPRPRAARRSSSTRSSGRAKESDHVLEDAEILEVVQRLTPAARPRLTRRSREPAPAKDAVAGAREPLPRARAADLPRPPRPSSGGSPARASRPTGATWRASARSSPVGGSKRRERPAADLAPLPAVPARRGACRRARPRARSRRCAASTRFAAAHLGFAEDPTVDLPNPRVGLALPKSLGRGRGRGAPRGPRSPHASGPARPGDARAALCLGPAGLRDRVAAARRASTWRTASSASPEREARSAWSRSESRPRAGSRGTSRSARPPLDRRRSPHLFLSARGAGDDAPALLAAHRGLRPEGRDPVAG